VKFRGYSTRRARLGDLGDRDGGQTLRGSVTKKPPKTEKKILVKRMKNFCPYLRTTPAFICIVKWKTVGGRKWKVIPEGGSEGRPFGRVTRIRFSTKWEKEGLRKDSVSPPKKRRDRSVHGKGGSSKEELLHR